MMEPSTGEVLVIGAPEEKNSSPVEVPAFSLCKPSHPRVAAISMIADVAVDIKIFFANVVKIVPQETRQRKEVLNGFSRHLDCPNIGIISFPFITISQS